MLNTLKSKLYGAANAATFDATFGTIFAQLSHSLSKKNPGENLQASEINYITFGAIFEQLFSHVTDWCQVASVCLTIASQSGQPLAQRSWLVESWELRRSLS